MSEKEDEEEEETESNEHKKNKNKKEKKKNKPLPLTTIGTLKTFEDLQKCLPIGTSIENRYCLKKVLGQGSFGIIYLADDLKQKNKKEVAIKFEITFPGSTSQLRNEYEVYNQLQGKRGFPEVYAFGTLSDWNCHYMVMQLMGKTLEAVMKEQPTRQFSLKTVLMIALQLVDMLQQLHAQGYVHRDIKPENMMLGRYPHNQQFVHLLDMGLAKRYLDPSTGEHLQFVAHRNLAGTARYAGVNSHMCLEQTRRDDIESMIYVLMYLRCGKLRWQGLPGKRQKKYGRIETSKLSLEPEDVGEALTSEFKDIFNHSRGSKYAAAPDYIKIKQLINACAQRHGYDLSDYRYDWNAKPKPQSKPETEDEDEEESDDDEDENEEDEDEESDDEDEDDKEQEEEQKQKPISSPIKKPAPVITVKPNNNNNNITTTKRPVLPLFSVSFSDTATVTNTYANQYRRIGVNNAYRHRN